MFNKNNYNDSVLYLTKCFYFLFWAISMLGQNTQRMTAKLSGSSHESYIYIIGLYIDYLLIYFIECDIMYCTRSIVLVSLFLFADFIWKLSGLLHFAYKHWCSHELLNLFDLSSNNVKEKKTTTYNSYKAGAIMRCSIFGSTYHCVTKLK